MRRIALATAVVAGYLQICIAAPLPSQAAASAKAQTDVLTNPLLPVGPDPWVIFHAGFYYYMNSTGKNLTIWKTRAMSKLGEAEKKVVWTPPASGPYSHDIWAPELHFLEGKWYIYFSGDAGTNQTHRVWVLENSSPDPLEGEWTFKGKLIDSTDKCSIDGSAFENRGQLYFIWSGWEGDVNGAQSIYIAKLKNPWTVEGKRVRLSTPDHPWEEIGDHYAGRDKEKNPALDKLEPLHINVNEGPEVLQHDGKIFLIYSGAACWTDFYALGMLEASASSDLLAPDSWKKSSAPVFWQSPSAHAFGTGHNSFFKSPDGKQDWIIYHANPESNQGCGNRRSPRAQPFTWNSDGTPNFGRPVPLGEPIAAPSGELRN